MSNATDQLISPISPEKTTQALQEIINTLQKNPAVFKPGDPRLKVRCLILAANREGAQKLNYQLQGLIRNTPLRTLMVDGTLQKGTQFSVLRNKTDILISTPAYLPKYVEKEAVSLIAIEVFMITGLDEIFKNGMHESIEKFLVQMPWVRQNIVLSQTLDPEVAYFAYSFLKIDRPADLVAPERPMRERRERRDRGDRDSRGPRRESRGNRDSRPPREDRPAREPRSEFSEQQRSNRPPRKDSFKKDNNRSSYKNRHHQDRYLDAFSGDDQILAKPPVQYDLATSQPVHKKKGLLSSLNPLKWLNKKEPEKIQSSHKPARKHYSESRPGGHRNQGPRH